MPSPAITPTHEEPEKEKSAPWLVRKLIGSLPGRVVMSSYETLRAAGTSVVCLSPWGDSSPVVLPCIQFRDLAVHAIVAATGGAALVAAPVMDSLAAEAITDLSQEIFVDTVIDKGFERTAETIDHTALRQPLGSLLSMDGTRSETTAVKVLLITLKYHATMSDAALGYFRSSIHGDHSLFSSVKDYLAVEKGWFSPYLFASARRPAIPRNMSPDIVFCHSPFLQGDYQVGGTLLKQSAFIISFATPTPPLPAPEKHQHGAPRFLHHRSPQPSSAEPELLYAALPLPPQPRRMVIMLVGIKPHRGIWSTSARPSESIMKYILLNGSPAIVVPVKIGAPLVAWDTLTLEKLWKLSASEIDYADPKSKFGGIVEALFEYLDMCVDWERFEGPWDLEPKRALDAALALLVTAAIRSKESKEVQQELDKERAGIAMWRIP
uniref:Uncharacterized protein n=1 Tax=Mycena chlorophos TaxID=658473 RepID=A0ABQ0KV10_MYCCL|nr:predicted protein [Mycena chlorophos]